MRLMLKIRASLRPFAAVVLAVCVFASGRVVFASEQQPPAQPPVVAPPQSTVPTGPQLQVSADDAVRMALENNLGMQVERLAPQIQALALSRAQGVYEPTLFSNFSRSANTSPPTDFLSASVATATSGDLRSDAGVTQRMKWFGGSYSVSFAGSRNTTDAPRTPFSPQLGSSFNARYDQPLLRDFRIDFNRVQIEQSKNNLDIADIQLMASVTQTGRTVRDAYYSLVGAIGQLEVARQSLALSNEALRQNRRRVEVGVMAQIDIVEAQAEVARVEEQVILAEVNVRTLEDNLRQLVLNPAQPDFWTVQLVPTEKPTMVAQAIDVEAATQNALKNRTDLAIARKQLDNADLNVRVAQNNKLPLLNLTARYGATGVGGTRNQWGGSIDEEPFIVSSTHRPFNDVLNDVFGNEFRNWGLTLSLSYPIGNDVAEAALAQSRLQRQQGQISLRDLEVRIAGEVRDAGRQVTTSLQRVDATRKAREFAQIRLDAEEKRITAGLSTTFQLLNAQQALSQARQSETRALIDYNRALVAFQAVQTAPVR